MASFTLEEALESFAATYGKGEKYRDYSAADDKRLADRVPPVMRAILRKDGWCSYRDQVLWLCDPDDWKDAVAAWFPDDASPQLCARSAFGDLFVLSGTFWLAIPHMSWILQGSVDPNFFFGHALTAKDFMTLAKKDLPPKVSAARKSAGPLAWDEMFTYAPPIAETGNPKKSKVKRVKAQAELVRLASLKEIDR